MLCMLAKDGNAAVIRQNDRASAVTECWHCVKSHSLWAHAASDKGCHLKLVLLPMGSSSSG